MLCYLEIVLDIEKALKYSTKWTGEQIGEKEMKK